MSNTPEDRSAAPSRVIQYDPTNEMHQAILHTQSRGENMHYKLEGAPAAQPVQKEKPNKGKRMDSLLKENRPKVDPNASAAGKPATSKPVEPTTAQELSSLGVKVTSTSDRDKIIAEKQARLQASREKGRAEAAARAAKMKEITERNK